MTCSGRLLASSAFKVCLHLCNSYMHQSKYQIRSGRRRRRCRKHRVKQGLLASSVWLRLTAYPHRDRILGHRTPTDSPRVITACLARALSARRTMSPRVWPSSKRARGGCCRVPGIGCVGASLPSVQCVSVEEPLREPRKTFDARGEQ